MKDSIYLFLKVHELSFCHNEAIAKITNSAEVGDFLEVDPERELDSPFFEMLTEVNDEFVCQYFGNLSLVTRL